MDFLINDLQKTFGKTPINYHSNAIALKNKRIRNALLITGAVVIVGGVAYIAYQKGKKSREEEMTQLKRNLREMKYENEKLAYMQQQQKKTIKRPTAFKEKMAPVDAVPVEEILSEVIPVAESQSTQVEIIQEEEKTNSKDPISINEDEIHA